MAVTINGTTGITYPDSSVENTAATGFGFKNRIINGAMMIDQRNAGASVTPTTGTYTLDRWNIGVTQSSKLSVQQAAASGSSDFAFTLSLKVTSLSAYTVLATDSFALQQSIEGFNVQDLYWGTAFAATVTLSFWTYSSLTGTFGGAVRNSALNRSYPFTYTINSANTWEHKTVTIAGDTAGTWLTTNGIGINIVFGLGVGSTFSGTAGAWASANYNSATGATSVVGTNAATFYITGVQLEKGSTATSFDVRPYGTELALCQRYYFKNAADQANSIFGSGAGVAGTQANIYAALPVTMRSAPSITGSTLRLFSGTLAFSVTSFDASLSSRSSGSVGAIVASGLTAGQVYYLQANGSTSAYIDYSAEL